MALCQKAADLLRVIRDIAICEDGALKKGASERRVDTPKSK